MGKRKQAPRRLRPGLLVELGHVFDEANDMAGAGDPETFDEVRERIEALRREVIKVLKAKQLAVLARAVRRRANEGWSPTSNYGLGKRDGMLEVAVFLFAGEWPS